MRNFSIENSDQLSEFMSKAQSLGQNIYSAKGTPPAGAVYSDGSPVVNPVNVAWINSETGEKLDIVYKQKRR